MKKLYLNNIKWITVCLVVIYHCFYMYNGVITDGIAGPFTSGVQYQDVIQYILYPWFMTILFVISGMCARYELEKRDTKEFLRKRTTRYLVPSTIGLLVYGWIQGYFNMSLSNVDTSMIPGFILYPVRALSGTGVLWYIQMLWLFSWILVFIRKHEKGKLYNLTKNMKAWMVMLLVVLYYLSAQILNTPVIVVYKFGIYGFCFFAGYFIFSHDEVIDELVKTRWINTLIAIVFGVLYIIKYFGMDYSYGIGSTNILCMVYSFFMILAILGLGKKYLDKTNKFMTWMSNKSWGLYIFHYLPLSMFAYYAKIVYHIEMPAICYYLITIILEFLVAYLLYEILSRIPFVRWAVLGIKKEKKAKE